MSSGIAALLDDVAAIAKLAAASIDDVTVSAGKASAKAAGVVIDDAAVTPRYVTGFSADRELPMIGRIALGSLRNKLLLLLPAALFLSAFLPWAITPLLMLGGAFLCFEGAEKIVEGLFHKGEGGEDAIVETGDPAHLEAEKVSGAIRTDLILSAEIMAISLADIASTPIFNQAAALVVVSLIVTAGVYGVVALIVKLDDIGLHLARGRSGAIAAFGRALVRMMPGVLSTLSIVGMAAMLWVGGGIIIHGLEVFGYSALGHAVHHAGAVVGGAMPALQGVVGWIVSAALSGVVGLVLGAIIVTVLHVVKRKPA